jgi:1,4-dihydroxy-2-naphthoyl-CoA hydrolase
LPALTDENDKPVTSTPDGISDQTRIVYDLMPFARTLGLTMVRFEPEGVSARLSWRPAFCTAGQAPHGEVVMALADSTGGACAFLNLPKDAQATTIESKTNFLRAVREGDVEATSRPLHVGRTVIAIETDVRDDRQRLVARVIQSQLVAR